MIRLSLTAAPDWQEILPGLRLLLAPLGTRAMVAARADPVVAGLTGSAPTEERAVAMARALARQVILDWEGVTDAAGKPLPVSPAAVDALMELWPVFEAFQTRHVAPALLLEQEKNASSPSPTGASAGAKAIARPARGRAKTARAAATLP